MKIIDNRTPSNRAQWQGLNNTHQFIAIHYLGVDGENFNLYDNGYGGHYTIAWNGDIYWSADHNAVLWQVGTAGYYAKKYPNGWDPTNYNTVGIEMCCHCTNGHWWFTEETQQACVELVKYLLKQLNLDASRVLRHYDIVNKNCPAPYVTNEKYKTSWTWNEFLSKVKSNSPVSNTYNFTLPQITIGQNGAAALLLQKILLAKGYTDNNNTQLALDGSAGNCTISALKKFQKDKKLSVDGICGPASWSSLLGISHFNMTFMAQSISLSSKIAEVLLLQELLKANKLYTGELDQSFGNQTLTALKNFQKQNNLSVDGVCGPNTWKKILGI